MKLEVEEARGILVLRSVKGDRPKRLVPLGLLCAYAFQAHHRHHQQQKQRVTTCPSASTFFFSDSEWPLLLEAVGSSQRLQLWTIDAFVLYKMSL